MPFFPDAYDQWSLCKYVRDRKCFDTLFEGTEEQCRQYACDNYAEQIDMCLMDWEGREWGV